MSSTDRLTAIKKELNDLLEAKIGNLLGVVRATQQVTRQLIETEEEIRRQAFQQQGLEAELGPARGRADSAENRDLQARLDRLQQNVERMKSVREGLMNNLATLKAELGAE